MRAGYRAEGSKLQVADSATETYDEAIQTELELHRLTGEERHLERAFRFAEKSKVGILRDALNEAEARSFSGIPREVLDRERRLRADLAAADQRLTEASLESDAEAERLQPLRDKQFALKRGYEALQRRLEEDYPAYYDLRYRFDTAAPAEIREGVLEQGTVLVEYFLGRTQIYIFTITRQDEAVSERRTRGVPRGRPPGPTSDDRGAERGFVRPRRASAVPTAPGPGRGPDRGQELVIVPDGPLSTVAFEALLEREAGSATAAGDLSWVLQDHAVSYAYSATVALQGLRAGTRSRRMISSASRPSPPPRPLPAAPPPCPRREGR